MLKFPARRSKIELSEKNKVEYFYEAETGSDSSPCNLMVHWSHTSHELLQLYTQHWIQSGYSMKSQKDRTDATLSDYMAKSPHHPFSGKVRTLWSTSNPKFCTIKSSSSFRKQIHFFPRSQLWCHDCNSPEHLLEDCKKALRLVWKIYSNNAR